MPEESIMQATLSRQTLARAEQQFTGVHHRVASPHARSSAVTQPTLAFARLRGRSFVWAEGEEPARLIFLIAVPEDAGKTHLKLLSKLARKVMETRFRDELYAAQYPTEAVATINNIVGLGVS